VTYPLGSTASCTCPPKGAATYKLAMSLTLSGISLADFVGEVVTAFKVAVVSGLNKDASLGLTLSTKAVTIVSLSRRGDTQVAFTVDTMSTFASVATSAAATLNEYMGITFQTNFNGQIRLTSVGTSVICTGVTVTSKATVDAPSASSSGLSTAAIAGIVVACCACCIFTVAVVAYCFLANKVSTGSSAPVVVHEDPLTGQFRSAHGGTTSEVDMGPTDKNNVVQL